jgi:hypothetical protein
MGCLDVNEGIMLNSHVKEIWYEVVALFYLAEGEDQLQELGKSVWAGILKFLKK